MHCATPGRFRMLLRRACVQDVDFKAEIILQINDENILGVLTLFSLILFLDLVIKFVIFMSDQDGRDQK